MAGTIFWDLAASNGVPHVQFVEKSAFRAPKRQGYSKAFLGVSVSEKNVGFYAWNSCLGLPGVCSWGTTAGATLGPFSRAFSVERQTLKFN